MRFFRYLLLRRGEFLQLILEDLPVVPEVFLLVLVHFLLVVHLDLQVLHQPVSHELLIAQVADLLQDLRVLRLSPLLLVAVRAHIKPAKFALIFINVED